MRSWAWAGVFAAALSMVTWIGCGSGPSSTSADAGPDASSDAPHEAAPTLDAGDAQIEASATDASDAAFDANDDAADAADPLPDIDAGPWDYLDLTLADSRAGEGYEGSAFDGRYLYLVPHTNSLVARFDTKARFRSLAAWSFFPAGSVRTSLDAGDDDAGAMDKGFVGAIFDGRYVYFIPWSNMGAPNTVIARYDTTLDFETRESWTLFDLATVNANAGGCIGGVFDGRYVYFVPDDNASGVDGLMIRFDTQAAFQDPASYASFDVTTVSPSAGGFFSGVFDGKYVYFAPFSGSVGGSGRSGVVARVDTTLPFTDAASWSVFDVTTVNAGAAGFNGSAFDGRYVYFVPGNNGMPDGILARYDSTAPFTSASAWQTTDFSAQLPGAMGFGGAVFDGRFLYLPPYSSTLGTLTDLFVWYDTTTPFGSAGDAGPASDGGDAGDGADAGDAGGSGDGGSGPALQSFSLTSLYFTAKGYVGGGFDGQYVYLTPFNNGLVVRYEAKTPPGLPPHIGSFL